jgi:hypothetical protein
METAKGADNMPVLDNTPVPYAIVVIKGTSPGDREWHVTWRAYKGATLVEVTSVTTGTASDDWTSLASQRASDMESAYFAAGYALP